MCSQVSTSYIKLIKRSFQESIYEQRSSVNIRSHFQTTGMHHEAKFEQKAFFMSIFLYIQCFLKSNQTFFGRAEWIELPILLSNKTLKRRIKLYPEKTEQVKKWFSTGTVTLSVVVSETTVHRIESTYYSFYGSLAIVRKTKQNC